MFMNDKMLITNLFQARSISETNEQRKMMVQRRKDIANDITNEITGYRASGLGARPACYRLPGQITKVL